MQMVWYTLPVFYKPVLLSTVFPIPYYKNSMCHLGTGTMNSVKNATCIELAFERTGCDLLDWI